MSQTGKKKICFIAHEFGYFKNHGGIATYLHNTVRTLLEHYDFDLTVLTQKCDLQDSLADKITLKEIKSDAEALEWLLKLQPDFVETTDYRNLGYQAMLHKALGRGLIDTTFIVNHHTNIKECFVWTEELPFVCAPADMQREHIWELAKFHLADQNIAPSTFMARYVQQQYGLKHVNAFQSVFIGSTTPRAESLKRAEKLPDLTKHIFNVCCIARFEGRKKQAYLVQQFITFLNRTGAKANLLLAGNSCLSDIDGVNSVDLVYSSVPEEYRDRVHFFDFLSQQQQFQLLGASDLYVLPSTFESFGFSIVETVYRGMPVLCSKYCGTAEAMGNERSSMTFDPFMLDDLSYKIEDFYNCSEEDRSDIAQRQQKSFMASFGPQAIKEKVDTLFSVQRPTQLLDVTAVPCVHITEDGMEDEGGAFLTHYVLSKEVDHYAGSFLGFHMQISPKLQDAVLVFYTDKPPLNLEDALVQGLSLALPATHLDPSGELYQDFIRAALKRKFFIAIKSDTDYTNGFCQKFYDFLTEDIPVSSGKSRHYFSVLSQDVWVPSPEEIDQIQKQIMSSVLAGVGLQHQPKPVAPLIATTINKGCVFIGKKGPLDKTSLRGGIHYILGGDPVPQIIDFMDEQKELNETLRSTVFAFHNTKKVPSDVIQALAMGCALAIPFAEIKFGKYPYKNLIDYALSCNIFTPVAMDYTLKKILPFYGYALRRTQSINMKDLFND